jgi:hypothetical protein
LLFIIVRSFVALKIKLKRVGKRIRFFDISFENTLAVSQACRQLDAPKRSPLLLYRFDRIPNQENCPDIALATIASQQLLSHPCQWA